MVIGRYHCWLESGRSGMAKVHFRVRFYKPVPNKRLPLSFNQDAIQQRPPLRHLKWPKSTSDAAFLLETARALRGGQQGGQHLRKAPEDRKKFSKMPTKRQATNKRTHRWELSNTYNTERTRCLHVVKKRTEIKDISAWKKNETHTHTSFKALAR